jgi:hypothetical protein
MFEDDMEIEFNKIDKRFKRFWAISIGFGIAGTIFILWLLSTVVMWIITK